jgi:hypothetical protein
MKNLWWGYDNLRQLEKEGKRVGTYNEKGVYATSRDDLRYRLAGNYYVIYTLGNKFVYKESDGSLTTLGWIKANGDFITAKDDVGIIDIKVQSEVDKAVNDTCMVIDDFYWKDLSMIWNKIKGWFLVLLEIIEEIIELDVI